MSEDWQRSIKLQQDGGEAWPSVYEEPVTSSDATSTPLALQAAWTTAGYKVRVDDLWISVDSATLVTVRSKTTNTSVWQGRLAADLPFQLTARNGLLCPDEAEALELITADAVNVYATLNWHPVPA
jgi:hypothetical protein